MGQIQAIVTITNRAQLSANFEGDAAADEPTVSITSHNLADDGSGVWRGTGTYEAFRGDGPQRVWEVKDHGAKFAVEFESADSNVITRLAVEGVGVDPGVKGALDATGTEDPSRPGTTNLLGTQTIGQGTGGLNKARPEGHIDIK